MKTVVLLYALPLFLTILFFSCSIQNKNINKDVIIEEGIEVLYFHEGSSCSSCEYIYAHTLELMEEELSQYIEDGRLSFKVLDLSDPSNNEMASKYNANWAALFINKRIDNKETSYDLTPFAFDNAPKNPKKFKEGLKTKVLELLKCS